MNRTLFALSMIGAGLAVACSSSSIPAGSDTDSGKESGSGSGSSSSSGSSSGGSGSSSGGVADSGGGDSGGSLTWYESCGYPVCDYGDGGMTPPGEGCPAVGSACTTEGQTCGTAMASNCGVTLICDNHDPTGVGGSGCPVSSRSHKDGIRYVDELELQTLHDEAISMKLATYSYKAEVEDPTPTHLGFIIEDNPGTPAVDPQHHRVDLYGYVSMVVAGMQVQEKEIAQLRSELEAARRDAASCRSPRK
jgi:hypothetical protein